MCNSKKCPVCRTPVLKNDFISCQNKKCQEFGLKYLPYEFNDMVNDLIELELLEKDEEL